MQRRVADMSKKLAILCLAVCAGVFGVGVLEGRNPIETVSYTHLRIGDAGVQVQNALRGQRLFQGGI